MKKLLGILTLLVFAFGFLYVSWHLGRYFEKQAERPIIIRLSEDEKCRFHSAVIAELIEPTNHIAYNNKYKEFTKK